MCEEIIRGDIVNRENNKRLDRFAPVPELYTDDRRLAHVRMQQERLLDL